MSFFLDSENLVEMNTAINMHIPTEYDMDLVDDELTVAMSETVKPVRRNDGKGQYIRHGTLRKFARGIQELNAE
ncbi:hypothetical protein NVP2275O_155 [Vibrio phage 2.275.O._10N.286.54.E11]|nr:hypothetical protein NVP2275O_155 [Vibrio phage 2.275.O._10N.286.54.E11]